METQGRAGREESSHLDELPPAARSIGEEIVSVDAESGDARLRFCAPPEFANRDCTVGGGFLAAMLDSTAAAPALAKLPPDLTAFTTDLHVSFVHRASLGALRGHGRLVVQDDRDATAEAELSMPNGIVVARAPAKFRVGHRRSAAPEREVRDREVEIAIVTPDGSMPAFVHLPGSAGPKPAVLLLMEAFGLTSHIRNVAARIAREGYVVLTPDLYYRELPHNKFGYDQVDEGIAMMLRLDHESFLDDARAALAYLRGRCDVEAGRIGVTGFCMGGGLSFLVACELSNKIAAAAPFYGMVLDEWIQAVERISVPVYLFFGGADSFIPLDRVREVESRFRALGKRFQIKVYPGADHGFFCDERSSYDRSAADDAWRELRGFLREHLGDGHAEPAGPRP